MSSIMLGCSVAVVSSAIQSLGITLQRKSHLLPHPPLASSQPTQRVHHQRQKRNMWFFGFMLFIISNILGSLIQITTLPLIILSPLQSIGLIFNSITSCLLLPGERFTRKIAVGTVVIAVGAFIIAYNGNVPDAPTPVPPPTIDERFAGILHKLVAPWFVMWFLATFIVSGILLLINKTILKNNTAKSNIKCQFSKGVNYGIISGTLTAHTFLFAKSIIDVVVENIFDNNRLLPLKNFTPYALLLTMLSIIGLQLTAFNLGLKLISTSILYPLCFLIYNLINLINDLIFNSLLSSHRLSYVQFGWILLGLLSVLCGVVVISWDSAFVDDDGHELETLVCPELTAEEAILYQGFPYTTQPDECSKLVATGKSLHGYGTLHLQPGAGSLGISNVSTIRSEARVLSFEQNQLLNLLDI